LTTKILFLESHLVEIAGIRDCNRDLIRNPTKKRHSSRFEGSRFAIDMKIENSR